MAILTDLEDVKNVLLEAKAIAVLGAHTDVTKAAYYVPNYLHSQGYKLFPVNPVFEGQTLFGEKVVDNLTTLETAVDVVDIFRRSEHLPSHLDEILAMHPLPKTIWFQLGIQNDTVAEELSAAGIDVIQSRCMLADHQRLL